MAELLSVGLDVGTTTTQLIVSRLRAENRASAFSAPRMEITKREILYESPVHFTPQLSGELVDGEKLRCLVDQAYRDAGISRQQVDTGAVIITGETSRKENAKRVLLALSELAGDFVVATAGPDLESVLAARGSGAVALSEETGKRVLHMDIGGGTSNLAWIEKGKITATACLNVGGRLVKFGSAGEITYLSPVLRGLTGLRVGEVPGEEQLTDLCATLVSALEAAAGLGGSRESMEALHTRDSGPLPLPGAEVISFSGGVADCIGQKKPHLSFGDFGPLLGSAIRASRLCAGDYRLGSQTIRATVIGAGCHSVQLSGSTVYCSAQTLPLKNCPVAHVSPGEQELPPESLAKLVKQRMQALEAPGILYLPGWNAPAYSKLTALADALAQGLGETGVRVAMEADMAKALGHALRLRLPEGAPCLCLDGVHIGENSYLDIGKAVGPAYSVTVKTLILNR